MTNTVFRLKFNISSISHQQAVAEHWNLPEIFKFKDVASVYKCKKRTVYLPHMGPGFRCELQQSPPKQSEKLSKIA
jgi:hypothetical protein